MAEHGLKQRSSESFSRNRFEAGLARAKRPEKVVAVLLLFLLLTIAAASVTSVLIGPDWGSLWKGLLFGLLVGWTLAIFRQPPWRSAWIVLVIGVIYTLLSAGGLSFKVTPVIYNLIHDLYQLFALPRGTNIDLTLLTSATHELSVSTIVVIERVRTWLVALVVGDPTFDPVAAEIVWSILVWIVAAWAGWMVEARRNAVLAVIPAVLLSVGTLSFSHSMSSTIYVILGLVLILLAIVQHDRREQEWEESGVAYPAKKGRQIALTAIAITIGLILFSAFTSSLSIQRIAKWLTVQRQASASGGEGLAKSLGIISNTTSTPDAFKAARQPGLPRDLLIGSGPELSKELVMTVGVKDLPSIVKEGQSLPLYWRSYTYDIYTGYGWRSGDTHQTSYLPNEPLQSGEMANHLLIQEAVRPAGGGDGSVYAAGEPVMVSLRSQAAWRSNSDLFGIQIDKGVSYDVSSLIPTVDERTLRNAGQRYPDWVWKRYLALPQGIPTRVKQLALQLTSAEPTPYDRARAIERFLRTYPYTLDVPRPPANQDLVDFFLFDLKKGYCDYYASAMVVLARAAGIPARLVIGYASGEYNSDSQRFTVTKADAHSWVEVYFPETGWIPFEPTASRPIIEESQSPVQQQPKPPISPSETPQTPATVSKSWRWLLAPGGLVFAVLAGIAWAAYDWFRLSRLSGLAVAAEVYKRMRRYGALMVMNIETGDTPFEYARALSNRVTELASLGGNRKVGLRIDQQVQEITSRIVRTSYRPAQTNSLPDTKLISDWNRLRWQFRMILILKSWTALRAWFSHPLKDASRNDSTAAEHEE